MDRRVKTNNPSEKGLLVALLEKKLAAIAKERDELRDILSGYREVLSSAEITCQSLECLIDTLSESV